VDGSKWRSEHVWSVRSPVLASASCCRWVPASLFGNPTAPFLDSFSLILDVYMSLGFFDAFQRPDLQQGRRQSCTASGDPSRLASTHLDSHRLPPLIMIRSPCVQRSFCDAGRCAAAAAPTKFRPLSTCNIGNQSTRASLPDGSVVLSQPPRTYMHSHILELSTLMEMGNGKWEIFRQCTQANGFAILSIISIIIQERLRKPPGV
jgi:hypothetical protein